MAQEIPTEDQRRAARIAGLAFLCAVALALVAETWIPRQLVDYASAEATARNLVAHESLWRLGAAGNVLVYLAEVVLIAALYVLLGPAGRGLALFAVLLRLVEIAILVSAELNDLMMLRLVGGGADLEAFSPAQRQALARLALDLHGLGYDVGLFFAGLGSAVFAWLFLRSGYLPRLVALWGLAASLLLAAFTLLIILWPGVQAHLSVYAYGGPALLFELAAGLWLALRGIRPAPS